MEQSLHELPAADSPMVTELCYSPFLISRLKTSIVSIHIDEQRGTGPSAAHECSRLQPPQQDEALYRSAIRAALGLSPLSAALSSPDWISLQIPLTSLNSWISRAQADSRGRPTL